MLFRSGAFPFFKMKKDIDRPFVFYKKQSTTWVVSIIVWIVISVSIIFTCIEPVLQHDYSTAFWTAFGPIFFGLVGWALYARATHKQNEEIVSNR